MATNQPPKPLTREEKIKLLSVFASDEVRALGFIQAWEGKLKQAQDKSEKLRCEIVEMDV